MTPGGGGASATVAAGVTGASLLCRSTAGAIVVPSCETGMAAIRPVRLGSSPFRPGPWAYAKTEEHTATNTTGALPSAISILVLRIGPPSTFPTFPPCHLETCSRTRSTYDIS